MDLFKNYRIHHVGVVVPSINAAETFMATMGMEEDYRGFVEQWSCWCLFTKAGGHTTIELVVPEGGPLARFNNRMGGVHHFAYHVEDIAAASAELLDAGLALLEPEAIKGAGNFLCNFIPPMATRGVQIELVQTL